MKWFFKVVHPRVPLCCFRPQLETLSPMMMAQCGLTKCLELLGSAVPQWQLVSTGAVPLPLPVAQAHQNEIRAASGMNTLSIILMGVFSYISGEGSNPVKISFLCSSQCLGSLIWHDYNLVGRRVGRAFMSFGICSHKFAGLFPS